MDQPKRVAFPLSKSFQTTIKFHLINPNKIGKVISLTHHELTYQAITPGSSSPPSTPTTVQFAYLILALGSTYTHPFHATQATALLQSDRLQSELSQLEQARQVLIIGGGSVGVELAGEIASTYPDKQITLVTSPYRLLASMSDKASREAAKILKGLNVKVLCNDRVVLPEGQANFKAGKVVSEKGVEIEFDAFYVCGGGRANTDVIRACFPEWLDSEGRVQVNKNLQVKVCDCLNIFAMGDCCGVREEKMARVVEAHARVVAQNVGELAEGGRRMVQYEAGGKMMLVTVGRRAGVLQVGEVTVSGRVVAWLKRDLFLGRYRKMLGY